MPLDHCEPSAWFVAFHTESPRWWLNWLAMGRFKHVSAFGYVDRAASWVFFDFNLDRSRIYVVHGRDADPMIARFSDKTVVVRVPKPADAVNSLNMAVGAWCVPAVAHLIGMPGCALRPDALYRQCLANGGEIICAEGSTDETENP
nr:hypothetical protein [Gellertiella hungarica]